MLAHHFHWPYTELMGLDHAERGRWVRQAELLAGLREPGRPGPGLPGPGRTSRR